MALDEFQIKKPFGGHWSLFEEAHGDVRGGKHRARVFKSKFPVNYRTSSKMHFKFPGNFKPILWNESIVSPWRKRHFFQNAHNCWRGFPPDGKILMLQSYSIIAFADITHTSFQDMPTEEIAVDKLDYVEARKARSVRIERFKKVALNALPSSQTLEDTSPHDHCTDYEGHSCQSLQGRMAWQVWHGTFQGLAGLGSLQVLFKHYETVLNLLKLYQNGA